jgi:antitoxin component YwqK of YwqJK toxin-antitoxin module
LTEFKTIDTTIKAKEFCTTFQEEIMRIIYAVVLTLFIGTGCTSGTKNADGVSYFIDQQATAAAQWPIGATVAEGRESERKFLGVTDQGYYLVQEFYSQSEIKRTDPYVVVDAESVSSARPNVVGKYVTWFANGQKRSEDSVKDRHYEGFSIAWHDNGQQMEKGLIKNGKRQGLWIIWYRDGKKKQQENYRHGNRQGLVIYWDENGQKSLEANYVDGKQEGRMTAWYENGQMMSESFFHDDKLHGAYTRWEEDGRMSSRSIYENGDEVETVYY